MSTTPIREEMKSFIRGLITEATELTFPEDAAVAMLNMNIDKKGVLKRRNGLELENNNSFYDFLHDIGETSRTYRWNNVAGDPSKSIVVIYFRGLIGLFNITSTGDELTSTRIGSFAINGAGSYNYITLSNWSPASVTGSYDIPCSFSSGNGKLYIVHPDIDTLEVEWVSASSFNVTSYTTRIRDFDGASLVGTPFDGNLSYKPDQIANDNTYWYNINNQGWENRLIELRTIFNSRSRLPSLTEQWQYGKYINVSTGEESFSVAQFEKQEFGEARAPMGHFILDAFNRVVETPTGIGDITEFNGAGTNEYFLRVNVGPNPGEWGGLTGAGGGSKVQITKPTTQVTYDNGAGCGTPVNFNPEQTIWRANGGATTVYDLLNHIYTLDDVQTTDTNSNATTAGFYKPSHGLHDGDRISFTGGASWNYDNGGGCGAPATFTPGISYTVTKIDEDYFTIPATLTGFVTWCTTQGESLKRTLMPLFNAFCSNPIDNFYARMYHTFSFGQISVRPRVSCFFQGRHIKAGIDADGYQGNIYISKIMYGENTDPGRCYQDADPTNEYNNELVPSDGLVLQINEMEKCIGLRSYGSGFLVFATNGIWFVWGGAGAPFTANNWTIDKISDINVLNDESIVEVTMKNEHMYCLWAEEGIYYLTQESQDQLPKINSLTEETIQTFYEDIPISKRSKAKGVYNPDTKKITWIYEGTTNKWSEELVLNVKTGAFAPSSYDQTTYRTIDIILMPAYDSLKEQRVKYVVARVSDDFIGASDLSNEDSMDYLSAGGVDAAGYIEASHYLGEAASLEKQIKYATMYFKRTETAFIDDGAGNPILNKQSSCLMRIYWDWTDHANAGKWSPQREVYRFKRQYAGSIGDPFNNGYPLTVSKNKIRGSGKSFRLRLDTVSGKRMEFVGWAFRAESRTEE